MHIHIGNIVNGWVVLVRYLCQKSSSDGRWYFYDFVIDHFQERGVCHLISKFCWYIYLNLPRYCESGRKCIENTSFPAYTPFFINMYKKGHGWCTFTNILLNFNPQSLIQNDSYTMLMQNLSVIEIRFCTASVFNKTQAPNNIVLKQ